jgi:hypothetical protein
MRRFSIALWLAAGIGGAIVFWLFQVLTGPSTIPQFMGQQIVEQGGYSKALTIPIGWGVHLGVSLSYNAPYRAGDYSDDKCAKRQGFPSRTSPPEHRLRAPFLEP